jgi:hypothetical protein
MKTLLENWSLFCSKLEKVKQTSNGIEALCPAHDDKKASLTASRNGEKILFKCQAGCVNNDILQTINMSGINSLFIVTTPKPKKRKRYAGIVTKTKAVNMLLTLSGLNQKILDHKGQTGNGRWKELKEYHIDCLNYCRA